jgi:hypothetical protein
MFLVLGLPRSRTFWLSKFLSYGDFECGHEEARYLRTPEDVKIWLNQDHRGSAETSVAAFWRWGIEINPSLRVVVVRRPVGEVVDSLMALDMDGICRFDADKLTKNMARYDAKLRQITRRLPNALSVEFGDLNDEKTVKDIFEFCLPYRFDCEWWKSLAKKDLQCSMRALMRYAAANRAPIDRMVKTAAHLSRAQLMSKQPKSSEGVTFQQEPFDDWERDGVPLFEAHCAEVGESPDNWRNKNIPLMRKLYGAGALQITTARCNGRMFGYVAAVMSPSLERRNLVSGFHTTFYVAKEMPGIGLKLQRASVAALRAKGCGEVFFHEGVRADGPRMGTFYKRMGAREFGHLHRLEFNGV